MSIETGIQGAALYVPQGRLDRKAVAAAHAWANPGLRALGKGFRAFCNWDEDAVTMAVEAGRLCLKAARSGQQVTRLAFATTTAPFQDRANTALVSDALGLDEYITSIEVSGSLRAGTSALKDALENTRHTTLLLAADKRPVKPASVQELKYGDGAVALAVGQGPVIARYLGCASVSSDLVDHYRTVESGTDYVLEERWMRDEGLTKLLPGVIKAALDSAGLQAGDIDTVIVPFAPKMVVRAMAIAGLEGAHLADTLFADIGDTGVSHALLMLHEALIHAEPGQKILVLGFGQGVDALVFDVTDLIADFKTNAVPAALLPRVEDDNYLKFLSFNDQLHMDWGIRAERDNRSALSAFYRKRHGISGFVGGKCVKCGVPQFPKSRACVECGEIDAQQDYSFADSVARIKTFTEDWQAHTPSPPLVYGNIAFEEGGNLFMELTDGVSGAYEVGQKVRMVFRVKDIDEHRGFRRYFWKAVASGADRKGA